MAPSESSPQASVDEIYGILWSNDQASFAFLDQSLHPRSLDLLYEVAEEFGIRNAKVVLDLGCGLGGQSRKLARRFGSRVIGLDPVEDNVRKAVAESEQENLVDRTSFLLGSIESMPLHDETIDFVWCRDMLNHVGDLRRGMQECARVLRPGGAMLIYSALATEDMEPREAERLYPRLAVQPATMDRDQVEGALMAAGLSIVHSEALGGELAEHEETLDGSCSREYMRLVRMIRAPDVCVTRLGQSAYDYGRALYTWNVYMLIGKISYHLYVVRKESA